MSFVGNTAWTHGGAIYQYYRGHLTLRDSVVSENETIYYAGGGVYAWTYVRDEKDVLIEGTEISDNLAVGEAGGLLIRSYREVALLDSVITDNVAGDATAGGGLLAWENTGVTVHGTTFEANFAGYGGGAYVEGHGVEPTYDEETAATIETWDAWTNTLFQENKARVGGALCLYDNDGTRLVNDTFVGNLATEAGGTFYLADTDTELRNSVVAWTSYGAAAHAMDEAGATGFSVHYSAFHGNADGDLAGELSGSPSPDAGNLDAAPDFVAYTPDGDPDNDSFVLTSDSALVDAGDPDLSDPDGTRSDIGIWGGPQLEVVDADGDGWTSEVDCDDDDASVHPEAEDTWYDGADTDCSGGSDYDADQDGLDAVDFDGEDCDDEDPDLGLDCSAEAEPR